MLKIKDNVDLKDLKKYGFKYDIKNNYYYYDETGNLGGYDEIIIYDDDNENIEYRRIIQLGFEPCPYFIENCLYDLIKAELVEKVD